MAGLIVAYFQFRKKRDGLISTAMEPVFGQAYKRPFRNVIDILAIIASHGYCHFYRSWHHAN